MGRLCWGFSIRCVPVLGVFQYLPGSDKDEEGHEKRGSCPPVDGRVPVDLDHDDEAREADIAGQDAGAAFREPLLEHVGMGVRPLAAVVEDDSVLVRADGPSAVPVAVHQSAEESGQLTAGGGGHMWVVVAGRGVVLIFTAVDWGELTHAGDLCAGRDGRRGRKEAEEGTIRGRFERIRGQ